MPQPIMPNLVRQLKTVADPSLSLDGSRLAYTLSWVDGDGWKARSRIIIIDLTTGQASELPDAAQNRPCSDVASQPDFYYEREGVPGACIFFDGSDHLDPAQQNRDTAARTALEDRGFRVITIRFDHPREEQVGKHPDVFGVGGQF